MGARFVAGVDGCKAGWIVVLLDLDTHARTARVVTQFAAVLALPEAPEIITVNTPIGLLTEFAPGGRSCDDRARQLLGPSGHMLLLPPTRRVLDEHRAGVRYQQLKAAHPAMFRSRDRLALYPFPSFSRFREVDAAVMPVHQAVLRETHSELCFAAANGGQPMAYGKKTKAGMQERVRAVESRGFLGPREMFEGRLPTGCRIDDVLDACIACWAARCVVEGRAHTLPDSPPTDARGLRMEIWVPTLAEGKVWGRAPRKGPPPPPPVVAPPPPVVAPPPAPVVAPPPPVVAPPPAPVLAPPTDRLQALLADLRAFVAERDWHKFHDPKNLSMLVASEAGELAAVLRWVDNKDADAAARADATRKKLAAEVADVTLAVLLLCERLGLDPVDNARAKLATNRAHYPVELSRGHAERPPREGEG